MWKQADLVRTPSHVAASKIGLEIVTWSGNEVNTKDLLCACPVVVCVLQTLVDGGVVLEAGTYLRLHGSIKSHLEILFVSKVDYVGHFVSENYTRGCNISPEPPHFKTREISTISEEEENADLHNQSVKVNAALDYDDDVLIGTCVLDGWLHQDDVLLIPCRLRPKFKVALKPPGMSGQEWTDIVEMLIRSSGASDIGGHPNSFVPTQRSSLDPHCPSKRGHHHHHHHHHQIVPLPCPARQEDSCLIRDDSNFETLLPEASRSRRFSFKDGVRKFKSMLNVREDDRRSSYLENSRSTDELQTTCDLSNDHNTSILSLLSSSNASLPSSIQGDEILNILRPMNYKRNTSASVKPRSRFSIFRAKKAKKSKQSEQQESHNVHSELEKTRRFVDLLDIVGKPKSSDSSAMGSILNLSELSHLVSCANISSSFHENSVKHLSMPGDIDKIRGGSSFHNLQAAKQLLPGKYVINRLDSQPLVPSSDSISRRKKIKTNLRIQNKFSSQVHLTPTNSEFKDFERRSIYPEDFSKSVENMKQTNEPPCNLETKDRRPQALGTSMLTRKNEAKEYLPHAAEISLSLSHLSIDEAHHHSSIRTNPHHLKRRKEKQQQQLKCNTKQLSKATLSTEKDFQFVRLESPTKTSENEFPRSQDRTATRTHRNTKEVIYENIGSTSDEKLRQASVPTESLDSRTNSTESSDFINSDSSFGGPNDSTFLRPKVGVEHRRFRCYEFNGRLKFCDDDGYQSKAESMDNFNFDSFISSFNYPFVGEVISYL